MHGRACNNNKISDRLARNDNNIVYDRNISSGSRSSLMASTIAYQTPVTGPERNRVIGTRMTTKLFSLNTSTAINYTNMLNVDIYKEFSMTRLSVLRILKV